LRATLILFFTLFLIFSSIKFFALEASGVLSSRFAIAECVATPEKVGCCPNSCHHIKIAVIKPVFTTTAYSSFYAFYSKYAKTPPGVLIKTDLNLLNATLVDGWGYSYGLYSFITSDMARKAGIVLGNNTWILSDIDVNNGALFDSKGLRRFDVIILGFTEYVTQKEYFAYKRFVASGGHILFLSACNFLAEVSYNPATKKVALVKGHGWVFNGTAAWRGPYARWYDENTNWVGSNYRLFFTQGYSIQGAVANTTHPLSEALRQRFSQPLFTSYQPHEENIVTNTTDWIIAYWRLTNLHHKGWVVAIYEHKYLQGSVIHTGVFGTDIIASDQEFQYFVIQALYYFAALSHVKLP
jgi:hypothetical protein